MGIRSSESALDNFSKLIAEIPLAARFIKPENIHLTLLFIGWVKKEEIDNISTNTGKVVETFKPFKIIYKSLGFFPESGSKKILWAGVADGKNNLFKISRELELQNKRF